MSSHRTGTIGSKSGTPIPRLPHFQGFVEQEGKRQAYLFVAGEGHDEDLGIWRWHITLWKKEVTPEGGELGLLKLSLN
jgi:hypothetical protein